MIDPEAIRQAIIARLPMRVRWSLAGVPLATDFSRCQAPLRTIEPTDIVGRDTQGSWGDLFLFGDQDYADGGGARPFLAVHRHTGEIVGFDVERESSQIYLLNSTVDAFIQTFEQLNELFRSERAIVSRLSDVLMEIDPQAFPKSDWRELIDEIARTRTPSDCLARSRETITR
jgi:hypothetical protein